MIPSCFIWCSWLGTDLELLYTLCELFFIESQVYQSKNRRDTKITVKNDCGSWTTLVHITAISGSANLDYKMVRYITVCIRWYLGSR